MIWAIFKASTLAYGHVVRPQASIVSRRFCHYTPIACIMPCLGRASTPERGFVLSSPEPSEKGSSQSELEFLTCLQNLTNRKLLFRTWTADWHSTTGGFILFCWSERLLQTRSLITNNCLQAEQPGARCKQMYTQLRPVWARVVQTSQNVFGTQTCVPMCGVCRPI